MSAHNSQFVSKKAYEICYAIFRMASYVKRGAFANHVEDQALRLVEFVIGSDYPKATLSLQTLNYLLKMGADVNVLNAANVETVSGEIERLNAAIIELGNSATVNPVDLDNIFSKTQTAFRATEENTHSAMTKELILKEESVSIDDYEKNVSHNGNGHENHNGHENGNGNGLKAAMRQTAILERIRQNNNCRLKDVQEYLPDVSERTLRYDLQNLIEKGLVERLGNGGPATYYRYTAEVLPQ